MDLLISWEFLGENHFSELTLTFFAFKKIFGEAGRDDNDDNYRNIAIIVVVVVIISL